MLIEALINGEVLTHQEVPDEYLAPIESVSWQQNCEARKQIIDLYLERFRKNMEKVFKETYRVEYCLVFTSKMAQHATD